MIGKTILHYEIIEKLGEGGMGVVYKVEDTKLDRIVALKFLPHQLTASDTERARFLQEAKAASALNHPNVCTIHDIKEHGNEHFIVMEYVDGMTLQQKIQTSPLSMKEVIAYGLQIGDALKEAHAKGIVHRDIKSENIMVNSKNQVKVMDFGLAKLKGSLKLTQASSTVGTLAYMAPEQIEGREVDARSDIFSFGVVLYEMLAGQMPFRGDYEAAIIYSIVNEEPEPIQKQRPEISSELLHVLNRALEKASEDRYQSVSDMIIDLRRVEKESSTVSRPAFGTTTSTKMSGSPQVRPAKSSSRKMALAFGAIIATLALAAGAFFYFQKEDSKLLENRVAVAIFENLTGDESLAPVGRMAADWITQGLSETGLIEVISTSAISQASNRGTGDILALAHETGATIVVSGSYYVSDDSISFRAEINEPKQRKLISSLQPVSGNRNDPKNAIEILRTRIIGALTVYSYPLSPYTYFLTKPPKYEAYREFILGSDFFGIDYDKAILHFKKAAELDTTFFMPLIWIATANGNRGMDVKADSIIQGVSRKREKLSQMERYYLDWYVAYLGGNSGESLKYMRQAEQLDPSNLIINYLVALGSNRVNRPQEAVETLMKLDREYETWYTPHPTGWWRFSVLTNALHRLGKHALELEQARHARSYYPDNTRVLRLEIRAVAALGRIQVVNKLINESLTIVGTLTPGRVMSIAAQELRAHGYLEEATEVINRAVTWGRNHTTTKQDSARLALTLYIAEHWQEAHALYQELKKKNPDNITYLGMAGVSAARLGDREEAILISAKLQKIDRRFLFGVHSYWGACIAAILGDQQRAVMLLRQAFSEGMSYGIWLHRDIESEALRDLPAFHELLRPKG